MLGDTGAGNLWLPNFLQRGKAKYSVSLAIALGTFLLAPVPHSLCSMQFLIPQKLAGLLFVVVVVVVVVCLLFVWNSVAKRDFEHLILELPLPGWQDYRCVLHRVLIDWLAILRKLLINECLFRCMKNKIIPHRIVYPSGGSLAIWCQFFFSPLVPPSFLCLSVWLERDTNSKEKARRAIVSPRWDFSHFYLLS